MKAVSRRESFFVGGRGRQRRVDGVWSVVVCWPELCAAAARALLPFWEEAGSVRPGHPVLRRF